MYKKYIKRVIDIIMSTCGIVILSPLFLVVAILVRTKLGSPVIFSQQRLGKDGEIFKIYKFRSMTNEKDENGQLLPDDIRITKFGKFLRSTSIDELPGLWNVLRGDMSIVGPRPLLVQYLSRYNKYQARRHEVLPGVTGLAQINGRNAISWQEKFDFDIKYVDNITFYGDIKIILKTVVKVLKVDGISQQGQATMEEFMGEEVDV